MAISGQALAQPRGGILIGKDDKLVAHHIGHQQFNGIGANIDDRAAHLDQQVGINPLQQRLQHTEHIAAVGGVQTGRGQLLGFR